jgi:hypothetical protein
MKTYVITLSQYFLATHKRAGDPTDFKEKFLSGEKIHTIRANYPLWEKRIKEVQEGRAVLSIRQWTGKPYRSKQMEIATLTAENGVGLQRLEFTDCRLRFPYTDSEWTSMVSLAKNDGLSLNDWVGWFGGYDLSEPMAIIHFTKFRY